MLSWLTGTYAGKLIVTFLISMVPVIELRGAIPYAVGMGLPLVPAALLSIVGNLLPVPFIILFVRQVFNWLQTKSRLLGNFVARMERRAMNRKELIDKYKLLGLYILVAIPLPGTGAWTGSLVAALFDIRLKSAFPMITAGVCTAAVIVGMVTKGVVSLF